MSFAVDNNLHDAPRRSSHNSHRRIHCDESGRLRARSSVTATEFCASGPGRLSTCTSHSARPIRVERCRSRSSRRPPAGIYDSSQRSRTGTTSGDTPRGIVPSASSSHGRGASFSRSAYVCCRRTAVSGGGRSDRHNSGPGSVVSCPTARAVLVYSARSARGKIITRSVMTTLSTSGTVNSSLRVVSLVYRALTTPSIEKH